MGMHDRYHHPRALVAPENFCLPPSYPADVVSELITALPLFLSVDKIKALCCQGHMFRRDLQPFLFRHINLRSLEDAYSLFDIFERGQRSGVFLGAGVRTLVLSMDLDPDGHENGRRVIAEFWRAWTKALPLMCNIYTITLEFIRDDIGFLRRFIRHGHPEKISSLRKLHLYESAREWAENDPDEFEKNSLGEEIAPWNVKRRHWADYICNPALHQLEFLIVTAKTTIFWPPTVRSASQMLDSWFSGLSPTSNLHTFVVHPRAGSSRRYLEDHREGHADLEDPASSNLDRIPPGLHGLEYCYMWPPGQDEGYTDPVPTLGWHKHVAGGKVVWDVSKDEGVRYCGLGEHIYFDQLFGERTARMYGYEEDIFRHHEDPDDFSNTYSL
ncbi:hypothetical protein C8R43DRAFT_1118351 [Mycena crocata]|nr:hypothetical protein C8R43DRAFT_1118351 [Mycena crocata]